MERVQICKYVKNYSEIEKIQNEYEVNYCVDMLADKIFLNIVHIQNQKSYSAKCCCNNICEKEAKNIMLFMYENSISPSGFFDVLQDLSVKFCEVK